MSFHLAAGEGFEPSQTESESVVLPLHNPAISLHFFLFVVRSRKGQVLLYARFEEMSRIFSKNFFRNFRPRKRAKISPLPGSGPAVGPDPFRLVYSSSCRPVAKNHRTFRSTFRPVTRSSARL